MGAFINNVHVFAADAPAALQDVLRLLRESAEADGFVEIHAATEADRGAALVVGQRWITIIDESFDSMDEKESARLAERISAGGLSAITSIVNDGEDLDLRLFENGKRVDRYYGRFNGAKPKGKPAKWAEFLAERITVDDLTATWQAAGLGEEILGKCCDLFGWRGDAAFASYRHLDEIEEDAQVARVFFRSKEPPIWKQSIGGPPQLDFLRVTSGPPHVIHLDAGEHDVRFHFSSVGGPGKGLEIVVGCETQDAIEPVSARIRHWLSSEPGWEAELTPKPGARWQTWSAVLDELTIDGALPRLPKGAPAPMIFKYSDEMNRRSFELAIRIRVVAPKARTHLVVLLRPVVNSQEGATSLHVPLLLGPLRRSLTLAAGTHLIAHAFFRDRNDATSQAAIEALNRWHSETGHPQNAYWLQKRVGAKVTNDFAIVANAPQNKLWPSAADVLRCNHVDIAQFFRNTNEDPRAAVSGFSRDQAMSEFGVENSPLNFEPGKKGDEAVAQLFLIHNLEDASEERVAELERIAAQMFDRFAENDLILQAYVARWARFATNLTPYEMDRGVTSQSAGGRSWTSRYLRGVGSRVWLGPELREAAGVSQTRFDADEDSIEDLERRLDAILPKRGAK